MPAKDDTSKRSDTAAKPGATSPPAISIPKGGGAIRGIGEKFATNPVTGTGAMSIPLAVSAGRSGFGPQLALSYDSGMGNGPFGFGWSLGLPSITRKTDKGVPRYVDFSESDVFMLAGAEDLMRLLKKDSSGQWVPDDAAPRIVDGATYEIRRYRPRVEGSFARIERWTRGDGDVHWRSLSKDNLLTIYGSDSRSRIADPVDASRVFSWLICETRDEKGNATVYEYKAEDGSGVDVTQAHERNRGPVGGKGRTANRYLKRIRYGNRRSMLDGAGRRPSFLGPAQVQQGDWMFEVVLDYGEHDAAAPRPDDPGVWDYRKDPFSSYRSTFEVRTTRLCQRVLMFHHFEGEAGVGKACLVRSTDLTYSYEDKPADPRNPIYSFLISVSQSGYQRQNGGYLKRSLPPVEFEYSQAVVQDTVEEVAPEAVENSPIGLDGTHYEWTDLHGEGVPGILTEQGGTWFYRRNLSPITPEAEAQFAPLELVAVRPDLGLSGSHAQFMDLAGDGRPDLVTFDDSVGGFYEHDGQEGWKPFRPFGARLHRDFRDPNLRLVDLDGDGHADVLLTEDDAFVWHRSLGEEGFGPAVRLGQAAEEEEGPRLVFHDGTPSIYLADLSGDGLSDLVRIRNGEVCYWPNLGYGRFGAKVTMADAPWFDAPEEFDQKRIRLADIDGSGTTDLIYLHRDGVRLYFNQSGNSWSPPRVLSVFPRADALHNVLATDLMGNGTSCLVWSSPLPEEARRPMRYVHLMGRIKPHLLVKTSNNLGAETLIAYAPSTKFYLEDKQRGNPWRTKLPFPVHVVERVETLDHVSRNRFVTRYAYHDGHFDGEEREFRGFGMVEQFDTEELPSLLDGGALPAADNVDAVSYVPPIHVKTWFDTGLCSGTDRDEAYREPGLTDEQARQLRLPHTELPPGLSAEEDREARRALRGSMLRQETYALDGSGKASVPYAVTEQNFTVVQLQGRGGNPHAVFFTHPREALSYHYERNASDPRVGHSLTLEVDPFGNVLKQAAVGYGRRKAALSLLPADRQRQIQTLLTYTENGVSNRIATEEDYRAPLPVETRSYELTGMTLGAGAARFSLEAVLQAGTTAGAIAYEQVPTPGALQKRLVEHLRTLYRRNDLAGALPFGVVQSLALPFENYKLAFTPGLVAAVYGPRVTDLVLENEGRYVHSQGDDNWWVPSGRVFYSPDSADTPAQELAFARAHFFLPHRYRDAFHTAAASTETVVRYDRHDLLTLETRDALGNRVTVGERDTVGNLIVSGNDYRVLQARLVMDPNRNRTAIAFDLLGMVVGTAAMGKPLPAAVEGDTLSGFVTDLVQAQLDAFFNAADPQAVSAALVKDATTRVIYDLDRFRRTRQAHPEDPSQWQPVCAATLHRETHVSAPLPAQGLKIQLGFSYSDGFGREIQNKMQAEPGRVGDSGPVIAPRWVASGWKIFNNKGKPVRQYEPFFSVTHHFEFGVTVGVSPVLFYDPADRVMATLHPNHTFEKVVFDPWQRTSYDASDTCAARGAETGDPRTDAEISGYTRAYFEAQPPGWLTWHAQRSAGAMGPEEQVAANRASAHADTPTTVHFDALGRPFLTVTRNRVVCAGHDLDGTEAECASRVELDIEGNHRTVRDAVLQAADPLGRVVMRYEYDMLGNRIHQLSMEAGARWLLNDVAGKPVRAWDARGHVFTTTYDRLHRQSEQTVRGTTGASDPRTLNRDLRFDRIEYGETQAAAEALNLRTRVFRHWDTAGVATNARLDAAGNPVEAYDFKGNLLRSTRRLLREYQSIPNWGLNPQLESEQFEGGMRYDALNRQTQSIVPHSSLRPAKINVIQAEFNQANLLEAVHVWLERGADPVGALDPAVEPPAPVGVSNVEYDAKGRRQRIDYMNGASTFYKYDPLTFRLVRLYTRRGPGFTEDCDNPAPPPPTKAAPDEPPPGQFCGLQNLRYTYDPVGNITHLHDDAQQPVYFRNQRVEPSNDYIYDALYRLIQAAGREHLGQQGDGSRKAPTAPDAFDGFHNRLDHPANGNAMGSYIERYVYDAVGNFLQMQHRGSDPAHAGWTRGYEYDETSLTEDGSGAALLKRSNRLSRTTLNPNGANPPQVDPYEHDVHGNMVRMPHLGGGVPGPNLQWDFRDHLSQARLGGGGLAHYVYDTSGQRVRKVWEKAPGLTEERIYLSGFEIFRRHSGAINPNTPSLERETLHVMDEKQRIALVETRTVDVAGSDLAPRRLIRCQFGNHLGSACLELDHEAQIISYEEYAPYGSSTFQAVRLQTETPKRYRYAGKERDEESGFSYYGGRYYAPWTGRWLVCDPAEFVDGFNLYRYVAANPARFTDPSGFGPGEQNLGASMEKASETHQDAANQRRAEKGLPPVKVDAQQGVGGTGNGRTGQTIPDEVKTTPKGNQKVVDLKARHTASQRNQVPTQREKDILANLEQVKNQLVELEKAGKIGPSTKGAALRVIHDSDKGASSAEALTAWRQEANAVRENWINATTDPVEKALRRRVHVTTTTRSTYTNATKNLRPKSPRRGGGGRLGMVVGVAIAAYILFDTGDVWAAGQTFNPAAGTTDALFSGNVTIAGVAEAALIDAFVFHPIGALTMLTWELMQPRGDNVYDEKLTKRAIEEGRNPFCAQCHGPGGALDPNNEWNQRARQGNEVDLRSQFDDFATESVRRFAAPQNQ